MDTKKVTALTNDLSKSHAQLKVAMAKYAQTYKELMKETSGTVSVSKIREALIEMLNESTK